MRYTGIQIIKKKGGMEQVNRTWEKVLGVIGVCLDGLAIVGCLSLWAITFLVGASTDSSSIRLINFFGEIVSLLSSIILLFVAIFLICFILALVALIQLKNSPKLSGCLFLVAAGISGFVYIFFMVNVSLFLPIQSIVYLIAGILCLRDNPGVESGVKEEEI